MPRFDGPADERLSLNEVMESIVQQLSKNDNSESVDAYQTLASTIKAYNEIPEQAVLKNKLTTITRHIRQHLSALGKQDPLPSDVNLVTSALKVLVILVWNPEFEALLDDDFRSFILDRSITIVVEHTAPKSVLVHYLHVLATQNFRSGLLTSNSRASRLVEALKALTEHVKGNGVVSERLLVYQRLLDQARPVMKSKSTQWVEHMLSSMASNIADTRNKALALGRKACQAFPASSSISGSVRLALDLKQESGRTLGGSICRRLEKMVMAKDDAVQVPQIWAVILLLCNNSSMRIDLWPGLKEWLMVIQRCFNGSDTSLRLQANSAWNRFVYIARPHEASDTLVAMLSKPVAAQLERTSNDKSSKSSHAVAMSSYCNLLYYAFRPATSISQYNRVWNEYIVKVMRSSFFEKSSGNADFASRILMSLFWDAKTNTKVWNENRAHENRLVEPEELPTIDCKWTRSRCSPALEIFQVLFRYSSWGFSGSSDQAYVAKAWRHFLKAIREAGSKEIKISNETRGAITSILKFLTQLWSQEDHQVKVGAHEFINLPKDVSTSISFAAVTELGVERILDLMEPEPLSFSPSLFLTIFQKLEEKSSTTTHKLFSTVNSHLEGLYERRSEYRCREICSMFDTISLLLSSLTRAVVEDALTTLEPALAVWLRDEASCFSPHADLDIEESRKVTRVLKRFVDGFTTALSLIPSSCVLLLDASLAAAFSSSHKTVVNGVAEVWNKRFGTNDEIEIGPQLADAIQRLLPYVELALPPSRTEVEHDVSFLRVHEYQTQFESAREPALEVDGREFPATAAENHVAEKKPDSVEAGHVDTRQSEPPRSARPRHDDSQVNFVGIDSSPPHAAQEESQYLTIHQKEVRDRQREEAAVTFTDLRSSPRPQSRHSEPRDCGLARRAATMNERPTTPTLPEHNDAMDVDPEPSPTPKSRLLREAAEVDVPSSPLSIHRDVEQDLDRENVSSPMPDAAEVEDQQVQLESPPRPFERYAQQQEGVAGVEEQDVAEITQRTGASEVLESAGTVLNPDGVAQPAPAPDDGGAEIADVAEVDQVAEIAEIEEAAEVEQSSEPTSGEYADTTDYQELPSSPAKASGSGMITPPLRSSSVLDTDQLEELSASQLERDLDWSAVLEGLDTPPTASKSPKLDMEASAPADIRDVVFPVAKTQEDLLEDFERPQDHVEKSEAHVEQLEADIEEAEKALPEMSQKKRKRPPSGYAERRKRRKSSYSQSQRTSSQVSYFKREDEDELLDCIVVDTSSEYLGSSSPIRAVEQQGDDYLLSQSAEVQNSASVNIHKDKSMEQDRSPGVTGGLKRRGRPRKSQNQVKQEPTGSDQGLDDMVQESSVTQQRQRRISRRRSRNRLSMEGSVDPDSGRVQSIPRVLIPTVEITARTSDAAQLPIDEEEPSSIAMDLEGSNTPPPMMARNNDIVINLQGILEQMKTAAPGSVDLRAVDELCFQIRFQAQITANAQASSA